MFSPYSLFAKTPGSCIDMYAVAYMSAAMCSVIIYLCGPDWYSMFVLFVRSTDVTLDASSCIVMVFALAEVFAHGGSRGGEAHFQGWDNMRSQCNKCRSLDF